MGIPASDNSVPKEEKSYFSSAVESINPWSTKRAQSPGSMNHSHTVSNNMANQLASSLTGRETGDHNITHLYGQSLRTYPTDCPQLNVQWYHAIDVVKRNPKYVQGRKNSAPDPKQTTQPKKFSAFSASDSSAIEFRYQQLLEAAEDWNSQVPATNFGPRSTSGRKKQNDASSNIGTRVPVNEDFLFDVDIEKRELEPVYWLGPIYEVRRGTWFFHEGSNSRPCEENLAAQLEEGYIKIRPWLSPGRSRSHSNTRQVTSKAHPEEPELPSTDATSNQAASARLPGTESPQPGSYRLFGTYMNNVVTYQDATTAWLSSDTMLSWVTSSMYERFAGGGYMSGVKLTRGFIAPAQGKEPERQSVNHDLSSMAPDPLSLDEREQKLLKRRSAPPTPAGSRSKNAEHSSDSSQPLTGRNITLQRQLSSLMESDGRNTTETEEEIQKRQEQEIQDYHTQAGESQGRKVDHLILVTHGIGQRLSLRMESVNFVHDVNVLRKTLKSVYSSSADLKALNSEFGAISQDFPRQREERNEQDLGDDTGGEFTYPSLDDITVEGMAFARSLISDLALDVLLYQSSYRDEISKIVLHECNRIFRLFKERNPEFEGKVHVMGHSLGSAILFEILCRHPDLRGKDGQSDSARMSSNPKQPGRSRSKSQITSFDFEVDNFFCLGSPIGLFQMLEGRTIAARQHRREPRDNDDSEDRILDHKGSSGDLFSTERLPTSRDLTPSVSLPRARQLFNIFHPSDPISYRLEPLISPAFASLKPQSLPYTKKGFLDAANQGLTGIGAKVGQSVSGLWSTLSAGIASNMLNRSLGLTSEEVARLAEESQPSLPPIDLESKTKAAPAESLVNHPGTGEKAAKRKQELADATAHGLEGTHGGAGSTLIDDDIETLFSQFQSRQREETPNERGSKSQHGNPKRVRRMRLEEGKIRALNRNGRVDYSIQESVLDYNPINTIASHMSYWADVDVNHFILSQLLSDQSKRGKKRG